MSEEELFDSESPVVAGPSSPSITGGAYHHGIPSGGDMNGYGNGSSHNLLNGNNLNGNSGTGRALTPPPYSGPSTSAQEPPPSPQPKTSPRYPGLPHLDYRLYRHPLFELSSDQTTIRSSAPHLSQNVSALVNLMRAQSSVPPKPQIHIVGKRPGKNKPDFAIKLNLMSLLVPEDPRQRMDYIRCVQEGEVALRGGSKPSAEPDAGGDGGGLEAWARKFVDDKTGSTKTFTLTRVVANLDTNWLEGQIRSLVASTDYRGVVTVTFPVTHARVVVQSPDRVNKFFTSVTTLFAGKKRYEVVKAVWPFATHKTGVEGRRCAVQSEAVWWEEWRDPIRHGTSLSVLFSVNFFVPSPHLLDIKGYYLLTWVGHIIAIVTKRHGWVTNEDKLEAIMEGTGKAVSKVDWGEND